METPNSGPVAFKSLQILHRSLLAGQVIFAVITFYLVYTNSFREDFQYLDKILQVVAIVFSAGGFYIGGFLFKRKLLHAREMMGNPTEKFSIYKAASLLQWALLEGPCLFVLVCFLLTHNYAFLVLAAVLILLFVLMAPSKIKIALQLQLSEVEIGEL